MEVESRELTERLDLNHTRGNQVGFPSTEEGFWPAHQLVVVQFTETGRVWKETDLEMRKSIGGFLAMVYLRSL